MSTTLCTHANEHFQTPVTSVSLSHAKQDAVKSTQLKEASMLKKLRHLKQETQPDVVVERPGRTTIRFVDAGVKFVDVKDRIQRVNASKRRATLKRERRQPEPSDGATVGQSTESAPSVSA